MLDQGGNAFDAAVAAAFASFVCESPLTSIGGGGFLMAHTAEGETSLYDFFPNVSGLGSRTPKEGLDFYPVDIDFTGTIQQFHIGKGSVAVPGCMAGFAKVFENHCSLPLKTILEPAIHYARQGVTLNAQQADFNSILSPILTLSPEGKAVYASNGRLLKEGELITKKNMADTIEELSRKGLESFYRGDIADCIIAGFEDGGLITREDLEKYEVTIRKPLVLDYRGRKIFTNPPPSSSGGCLIAFSLKLLEKYDVAKLKHNNADYLHLLLDVMKMSDEARGEDFDHRVYEKDIIDSFLSPENIGKYSRKLENNIPPKNLLPEKPATGNTTHISVVDAAGNAASVTTSNGEGCGHMIPGMGVMLNNMLGEEDINPHGFHTQPAGLRMSSMMSPTIVMHEDRPEAILGSGGSNRIRSAILQVILNLLDFNLPVEEAVNAPRTHWDKKIFQVENGIHKDQLENVSSPVNCWAEKNMYFGGVHTVISENCTLSGAGDSRRGGTCLKN
jgi:gamma-glutamyltranspeptidase/glutathione hydrolase